MHGTALGQQQTRLSPVVAGLGAAIVAAGITIAMSMSNSTSSTHELAPAAPQACQQMARKLLVSTTSGGGTVRLREGNYVSQPIKLSNAPQSVVFPLARPDSIPVEEVLTLEGNADDVVITSEVTDLRRVFDVRGVTAFSITWKPVKGC